MTAWIGNREPPYRKWILKVPTVLLITSTQCRNLLPLSPKRDGTFCIDGNYNDWIYRNLVKSDISIT